MSPRLSSPHLRCHRDANAVLRSNFPQESGVLSYRPNCVIRQFCAVVVTPVFVPPLQQFVYYIFFVCAKKKMIYFYARWCVAPMQALQSVWDWSVDQFPRYPMDRFWRCITAAISVFSVTVFIATACPYAASSGRKKVTATLKQLRKRFILVAKRCWHDALHETVDGLSVSAAWTARRLQPFVPTLRG